MQASYKIPLGSLVRDKYSGFTGTAAYLGIYLNGCNRYGVQPKINEKGELPEQKFFDEPDLEVITAEDKESKDKRTGGPHDHNSM